MSKITVLILRCGYFQAKLQDKKRKLRHIKNIVESTESIAGHFSRRPIKRTLSDESLCKPEPAVNNVKPTDLKSTEVRNYNLISNKRPYLCFNDIMFII